MNWFFALVTFVPTSVKAVVFVVGVNVKVVFEIEPVETLPSLST